MKFGKIHLIETKNQKEDNVNSFFKNYLSLGLQKN